MPSVKSAAAVKTPITTGAAISALATAITATAGVTILNLCAMENDCHNCPDRTVKCHATCERYKAFCERNEAIKDKQRVDYSPKDILVTGDIKRAKAVRTKTHEMAWRDRAT